MRLFLQVKLDLKVFVYQEMRELANEKEKKKMSIQFHERLGPGSNKQLPTVTVQQAMSCGCGPFATESV
jgi:hypothetical protein